MLYDLTYYDSSLSYSAVPFAWSLTGETRALLRWRMIALAPLNPSFIVCPPHLRFAICTVVHNVSWVFFWYAMRCQRSCKSITGCPGHSSTATMAMTTTTTPNFYQGTSLFCAMHECHELSLVAVRHRRWVASTPACPPSPQHRISLPLPFHRPDHCHRCA